MDIDPKESNYFFQNHMSRSIDMGPEGLDDIVMEWAENVVSGEYNIMTHKDTRKYEYRVRAVRVHKNTSGNIFKTSLLMDTGKYLPAHIAEKHAQKFIEAQKVLEEYRR
jgi:hypothetical protein